MTKKNENGKEKRIRDLFCRQRKGRGADFSIEGGGIFRGGQLKRGVPGGGPESGGGVTRRWGNEHDLGQGEKGKVRKANLPGNGKEAAD